MRDELALLGDFERSLKFHQTRVPMARARVFGGYRIPNPYPYPGKTHGITRGFSKPVTFPTDDSREQGDDGNEATLLRLSWEEGVAFMNYLLSRAVPHHDSLLENKNVRDWTFCDILRMPVALQKEWKNACYEELWCTSLRARYICAPVFLIQKNPNILFL